MSFGHWLNSLTLLDNIVILSIFAIGGWLSHLTMKGFRKIVERTKKGGAEIVKHLEKGSAYYAPAAAGIQMAESYLNDLKKEMPCAAYLEGQYGVKNIYAGVPVIIGKNGVEKVIEINLSKEEKDQFNKSVKAVQELFEAAKKIDNSLNI